MNTFWTLIDDQYYRLFNGELKCAPKCEETNNVIIKDESRVEVISRDQLEKINLQFGTSLTSDDIYN